jgi:hypothetical protein
VSKVAYYTVLNQYYIFNYSDFMSIEDERIIFDNKGNHITDSSTIERILNPQQLKKFKKREKYGVMNRHGEVIIQPDYGRIYFLSSTIVVEPERYGYDGLFDFTGKELLPPKYSIQETESGVLKVQPESEEKSYLITKTGMRIEE